MKSAGLTALALFFAAMAAGYYGDANIGMAGVFGLAMVVSLVLALNPD